jgi:hypothetical protein
MEIIHLEGIAAGLFIGCVIIYLNAPKKQKEIAKGDD